MIFPIQNIVFVGSKPLGLQALKTIYAIRPESILAIVTFDDTADIRSDLEGFKKFSVETGKPLYIAKNSNDAEIIIQSLKPDLCLVVCWYWLLKPALLNALPHGAIGVHNSLLPKYRGGSPLVWAILNGEEEIGFSMFSLTEEMDAGSIWFQKKFELPIDMSVGGALSMLEAGLIRTLQSDWGSLLDGNVQPKVQDASGATYCAQRLPEDGRIDWTQTAKRIVDFIRAQSAPYPGAFTIFDEKEIVIQEAVIWEAPYFGTPGQVARASDDGVLVICGDNKAVLLTHVFIGGKEMPANAIFQSIKIRL